MSDLSSERHDASKIHDPHAMDCEWKWTSCGTTRIVDRSYDLPYHTFDGVRTVPTLVRQLLLPQASPSDLWVTQGVLGSFVDQDVDKTFVLPTYLGPGGPTLPGSTLVDLTGRYRQDVPSLKVVQVCGVHVVAVA